MRILFYGNCQGLALSELVNQLLCPKVHASCVLNFDLVNNKVPFPFDRLKNIDAFVYQPLAAKHGDLSTDHVIQFLPNHVRQVSFPYLYNSGFWPIFWEGNRLIGGEQVRRRIGLASTFAATANNVLTGKLFDGISRFTSDLIELKRREENVDVICSDLIEAKWASEQLFYTQNHPSIALLLPMLERVLTMLCINEPLVGDADVIRVTSTGPDAGFFPLHPHFGITEQLKWFTQQHAIGWQEFYLGQILPLWQRASMIGRCHYIFNRIARVCG
jgi:hypothetical protein